MATDPAQLVGRTFGPTGWRRVEQDEIDRFAAISGDSQWIHVDAERAARESPYGTTIAHGNLTRAYVDGWRDELIGSAGERLGVGAKLGVNMGYDRVRFPAPVPVGSELRATMEIVAIDPREGGWTSVTQRFSVELRGADKPVCVADSLVAVLI